MVRRFVLLFACFMAFGTAPAQAAAPRPAQRRVIVVVVSQTSVVAWRSDPVLRGLAADGSVSLLSTRSDENAKDATSRASAAFATLGAGVRRSASGDGTGLAESLVPAGVPFVVSPSLTRALGASPIDSTGPVPGALQTPAVAVIDDRNDHAGLDAVAAARNLLTPADVLIVLSPVPPDPGNGIELGFVAIVGNGFGHGLLESPSTRRAGVVALTDVAPTILRVLGLPEASKMDGRAVTTRASRDPLGTLEGLEADLIAAAQARRPLTRGILIVAMVLAGLAAVLLRLRRWMPSLLLLAVTASPLMLYVSGALHPPSTDVFIALVAIGSIVFSIALRVVFDLKTSFVVVLGLTVLVPLVDLLLGTPLGMRSPLAFQIAGGGRFYGVDDGVLGVVVGAAIFAGALVIDRADRSITTVLAFVLAVTVWVLGAPAFGAKFGAPLTAVPPFALLALRATGRKIDVRAVALIAIATLAATGALLLADVARNSGAQSHVARAVEGHSDLGSLIARKWNTNWRITTHTIWAPAIAVFAGALALGVWRERATLPRGLRAGVFAAIVAVFCAVAFNDEGVITAAPIALFAATTMLALQPDR